MQIIIRGQKVKTQLISKSLAHIVKDKYKPNFLNVSTQSQAVIYIENRTKLAMNTYIMTFP